MIRHTETKQEYTVNGETKADTVELTYGEINEPVDITLPEEAEGAQQAGGIY